MAFFLPQGPPPAFNASVQYRYRTLDGGPPSMGKPPSAAPGPPPPYSQFPFGGAPPPPGPPGFGFGAPPSAPPGFAFCGGGPPGPSFPFCGAPQAAPNPFNFCAAPPPPAPTTTCCTTFPPAAPGAAPNTVCWTAKPPEPPRHYMLTAAAAPAPPVRGYALAGPSRGQHPPDPGNRVNRRVVKADDGTGVLCSEDMTTFHILNPGRWFDDTMSISSLQRPRDFVVQHADSDWSVQKFIKQLGGLEAGAEGRLSLDQASDKSLVCVEQWVDRANNGRFERGSAIFFHDPKAMMSLRDVGWGPSHGRAGQDPPIWIMLYP